MAHDLMKLDDGGSAMFYVKDVPWHELGTRLMEAPSARQAMRAARLDWEVVKAPVFYHRSIEDTAIVPHRFVLTPGEGWPNRNRPAFGIVTEKYEVLQNKNAFSFFDPLVQRGYATYETAGALGKGERVWVLARLKGDYDVRSGDRIERYLLLSNTHDGNSAVRVMFTPIRVVCQNTLSMAIESAKEVFSIRHGRQLSPNMKAAADDMMDRVETYYESILDRFFDLRRADVGDEQMEAYLALLFPEPKDTAQIASESWERLNREALRSRKACLNLYRNARTCLMAGRTAWAAYNAVTEFVDHCQPSRRARSPAAQLNRIWFGSGYQIKHRAFTEALRLFVN